MAYTEEPEPETAMYYFKLSIDLFNLFGGFVHFLGEHTLDISEDIVEFIFGIKAVSLEFA